jgi:cation-transporting ATPase E
VTVHPAASEPVPVPMPASGSVPDRRPTPPEGLATAEVAERIASGQTNATTVHTSRPVAEIVRANVFTVFNGLLATLFAFVLVTGRWQNALFGGVVVANTLIGIVQEVRAKRTLDRLAVLNAPRARAVRDGVERDLPVAEVVLDDLLTLTSGDQAPVDGTVRTGTGLAVDESMLTGEADPVPKEPGDRVLSGSIVVAGTGRIQATAVGADAYAARLAAEARRYTRTRSELVGGTNRILRWIAVGMLVVGPAVLWSQFRTPDNAGWRDAVTGTVGALVGMVPEGLVLLTSLAFFVAAVSLARQRTLFQELPSV